MSARRGAAVLATALGLLLAAASGASGASYRYAGSFGRLGSGPGQFGSGVLGGGANRQYDDPSGITIAPDGTLFVVDVSNNRVEHFTATGAYRGAFGHRGRDSGARAHIIQKGAFYQPAGIVAGRDGVLYVVDAGNDRVMAHTRGGAFKRRVGFHGSQPGQWVVPWGAGSGTQGLYFVDQGNYRIQHWSFAGRFLGAWGEFGRERGQFVTPYAVAPSPGGDRVYVTDSIRRRLIMFGSTGQLLAEYGRSGRGESDFLKPTGVAVGLDGTVFVADRCNKRILQFSPNGEFVESFGANILDAPTFMAINSDGVLYVSDLHRVVAFAPSNSRGLRVPPRRPVRAAGGYDVACNAIQG